MQPVMFSIPKMQLQRGTREWKLHLVLIPSGKEILDGTSSSIFLICGARYCSCRKRSNMNTTLLTPGYTVMQEAAWLEIVRLPPLPVIITPGIIMDLF